MTESEAQVTNGSEKIGKHQILGLVAMCIAVFIVANDFTALSVAIPAIEKGFAIDITTAQWVINGYALSSAF